MQTLEQSPTDPEFVQNPYPFYERARAAGPLFYWQDYRLICATSATAVGAIMRDRRLGREIPAEKRRPIPEHLRPFYAVEAHSMLELEPPRHTRLRANVLRAFTSRRIAGMTEEITRLSHQLIDAFPVGQVDLLDHFARQFPVIVIARLLGVPEERSSELLAWSNAMVGMYQAGRSRIHEDRAAGAAAEFSDFIRAHVCARRTQPRDDLISQLIAAEGEGLSPDELVSTCILLLNAGHEATVHTIGNGVKALIENGYGAETLTQDKTAGTVEEILRHDPPLHLFTRHVYEDVDIAGHQFRRGDEVGCLLAAANRDPQNWDDPARFDPDRPVRPHLAFGVGTHFCVGAPLARLELQLSLPVLFDRLPGMKLAGRPRYANLYHFHGLESLIVHLGARA